MVSPMTIDTLLNDMPQFVPSLTGLRTQPLWGLRTANRFMHDGATRNLEDAIRRHDGQGRTARDRFVGLSGEPLAQLLAFLRSL